MGSLVTTPLLMLDQCELVILFLLVTIMVYYPCPGFVRLCLSISSFSSLLGGLTRITHSPPVLRYEVRKQVGMSLMRRGGPNRTRGGGGGAKEYSNFINEIIYCIIKVLI